MQKIVLSEGSYNQPLDIEPKVVQNLTKKIIELCNSEDVSYAQKNKALYHADKELYQNLLITKQSSL